MPQPFNRRGKYKKQMMTRGTTSEEHEKVVHFICEQFFLSPTKIVGNATLKGKYFPDAIEKTADWEVEVVPRNYHILKKAERWDNKRQKFLVLVPSKQALKRFNKIYVYFNRGLIEL